MEATYTVEAIVLSRQAWGEADSRVIVYAREAGKLAVVARGVKKPASKLAGHLEPFNRASLMIVNGRVKSYVGSARTLDIFYHLKQDLDKLRWAGWWLAEFNHAVQDNQADEKLYSLLASSLSVFNVIKAKPLYYQALACLYVLKLKALMGEGLDWESLRQSSDNQFGLKSIKIILARLYLGPPSLTDNQAEMIIKHVAHSM